MAVVTAQRPDDHCGRTFLQVLRFLRERLTLEPGAVREPAPTLRWVTDVSDAGGKPERIATARFRGFRLFVVEMGETSLAGQPRFLPRVSWCVSWGRKTDDVHVGGPAPTFEDAKARAELALRVQVGATMDS